MGGADLKSFFDFLTSLVFHVFSGKMMDAKMGHLETHRSRTSTRRVAHLDSQSREAANTR